MSNTSIVIRDLPFDVKQGLRHMAQAHDRSMEEEARQILRAAVTRAQKKLAIPAPTIADRIHARFAAIGGVELDLPSRDGWRPLPDFSAPPSKRANKKSATKT